MRGDAAERLAAVEAQQQRLLELMERLVPALERTAAALDRLVPTEPPAPAQLRLVR